MNDEPRSSRSILWRQVLGLAGLQGAISLAWVLYRFYLPQLLAGVGLAGTDRLVTMAEDALAAVLEPALGGLSDRARLRVGSRYPLVVAGVLLTVVLFGVIGAAGMSQGSLAQGILVSGLLLWAVAMAMFRSPAIALIGQYAISTRLPQAFSVLVLVSGLVGALTPAARDRILSAGPGYAFGLGSLVLMGAAVVLKLAGPDRVLGAGAIAADLPSPINWRSFIQLFGLGMCVCWGLRLFFAAVPVAVQAQLPQVPSATISLVVGVGVALMAVIMGAAAGRWGNQPVMLGSAIALVLGLPLLMSGVIEAIAGPLALVEMLAWAGLFNGGIPLAIELMPDRVGLGIGCFFGGFGATSAILGQTGLAISPWAAAIAFGLVTIVLLDLRLKAHQQATKAADPSSSAP
ncbi:MAG: hypothetical protein EA001_08990 [Oscillatoriales cyanobacterium]|nr:MAG: hypothetical protein EA001_08990 [Oscillatoriales cyanobacterium]